MSERYTRLFSLPENIGQDGCPVLISAGALLKDNNTGKLLVQLKLRNISEQVIKSVKVKINAYDTAEISLDGIEAFSYLDLAVERDGEFGSKTPIVLPDKTTRSVSVEILSVVFGNGQHYQSSNNIIASSIDSETTEKIQLLDSERKKHQVAIQEDRKRKIISFLPVSFAVLAIMLNGFHIAPWVWIRYLISLIIPFLCIWNYQKNNRRPIPSKVILYTSLAFLGIQILSALYYSVFHYQYAASHKTDTTILFDIVARYIDGCRIIYNLHYLKMRPFIFEKSTILSWISEWLFVAKNLCAVIILFLQDKKTKE